MPDKFRLPETQKHVWELPPEDTVLMRQAAKAGLIRVVTEELVNMMGGMTGTKVSRNEDTLVWDEVLDG